MVRWRGLSQAGRRAQAWAGRQARQQPRSRLVVAGVVVVTIVVVMVSLLGRNAGPTGLASPGPTATGSASARPSKPSVAAWQPLDLPPYEPAAELLPQGNAGSTLSVTGTLMLHSLTGTPATELATGLRAQPAARLTIEPGPTSDVALVSPAEPLIEATRYRFDLAAPDGTLVGQWTFTTGGPLHVVGLIPDDRTTQVPVDTGIELEFDRDNVVGVPDHFSIEPSVAGRFEEHGRTWVFVPNQPLQASTLYSVTLAAGVGVAGSDDTLQEAVQLRFETAGPMTQPDRSIVFFEGPMHELLPGDLPVLPVDDYYGYDQNSSGNAFAVTVEIYALPGVESVMDALDTLAVDLSWASWSSGGSVSTEGLRLVSAAEGTVTGDYRGGRNLQLPAGLDAGWYLLVVVQDGRDAQVVLQVTDLAAYAVASETRTVIWVNGLDSQAPVAGASVEAWLGPSLGRTDGSGLLDVPTPADTREVLAAGKTALMLVSAPDGRRLAVPLVGEVPYWYQTDSSAWWLLFRTDRLEYRRDDVIHAWGLVRSRASREAPAQAELRLVAGYDANGPAIARSVVSPGARGTFVADIPIHDLPLDGYQLVLRVNGEVIAQASLQVADIRKPTFRLSLETDKRAYIDGDNVSGTGSATFYDGTPASGLRLRLDGSAGGGEVSRELQTGPDGAGAFTLEAVANDTWVSSGYLSLMSALPEEGDSQGQTDFVVFPSTVWVTADASLVGGQLAVSGRLARLDLAAAEQQMKDTGWIDDPGGSAISGGSVTIGVNRITWKATQTGTTYDFLLKRVVPLYRYDQVTTRVGSYEAASGSDGAYQLALSVGSAPAAYEIVVSAADGQGRRMQANVWAAEQRASTPGSAFPYLGTYAPCGYTSTEQVAIGQDVELAVHNGDGTDVTGGRTLFLTGRSGVQRAEVATGASFEQRFADEDLPSLSVRAIRLTPAGYVVTNDYLLRVQADQTAIGVQLSSDRASYQPGDDVVVSVRTTGPDGKPIAADVIVRAVDLKLYAVGAVEEVDLSRLMQPISAGFLASYASHQVIRPRGDDGCGGGATSGGGDYREDFADLATFQVIKTDAGGRGTASFALPDDLTSWEVSAAALADGLQAGAGRIEIPAGLPFFIDSTVAPEYLAGEETSLLLRAFGTGLASGDRVRFTVAAPSLNLKPVSVEAAAFAYVRVPLPALVLGDHRITIDAERIGSGTPLRDAVARTIHVVPTRLGALMTDQQSLIDGMSLPGGDGITTAVIADAGRGSLIGLLESLAWGSNARFDTALSAELARGLLIDEFGLDEATVPPSGFDIARGGVEGLALLPYASPSLPLTARAALVAPDRMPTQQLRDALRAWADNPSEPAERHLMALAGLAGLGDGVLGELQSVNVGGLSARQQLWLALGLQAAGDEAGARAIERALLASQGRRLDRWVSIVSPDGTGQDREGTASMLLLAARLRDPIAVDISAYLADNPSTERVDALEQIGFARSAMAWLPRPAARFAWTLDGERHVEALETGRTVTLRLTSAQRGNLRLERLAGELTVATSWIGVAGYDRLPSDASVTIQRTVTPATNAPLDQLVQVRLKVTFASNAISGCYQVTDVLPSGLAPVVLPWNGYEEWGRSFLAPYEVEGQRVSWCIDPAGTRLPLGYAARVVTPGSFRWEPAVVQLVAAPSVGAATPVLTYTIR